MLKKVVVTARGAMSDQTNVPAETPRGLPDVILVPLSILQRLAIRCAKVYLSSLIAFLGASALGVVSVDNPVPLVDFIASLKQAAQLALVPAIGTLILNVSIFLTKLDETYPSSMG